LNGSAADFDDGLFFPAASALEFAGGFPALPLGALCHPGRNQPDWHPLNRQIAAASADQNAARSFQLHREKNVNTANPSAC
jgi:hypothetical protein